MKLESGKLGGRKVSHNPAPANIFQAAAMASNLKHSGFWDNR